MCCSHGQLPRWNRRAHKGAHNSARTKSGCYKSHIFVHEVRREQDSHESEYNIPLVRVDPPDRTIFPNNAFLRSISVLLIASTTIW